MTKTILETCDIWDTDYNSENWKREFMTIFATWQLIVTLDSIRNSCDVFLIYRNTLMHNNKSWNGKKPGWIWIVIDEYEGARDSVVILVP